MICLLAADNPGGANILACLFAPARARGHDLVLCPSGAAVSLWRAKGDRPFDPNAEVVATGTGFADAERLIWREAERFGIPSVAVIDAWMNLDLRFRMTADGSPCWPDVVAVPDEWVRAELSRFAPASVAIETIGQPHLEAATARLAAARVGRARNTPPILAWVSEPVAEDYPGGTRGFDQYQVFRSMIADPAWPAEAHPIVCPHPREDRRRWAEILADLPGQAELSTTDTATVLAQADGIIGMTSMVLVEAALAGIPTLSLQPGRTSAVNPLVDRLCPAITKPAAMGTGIRRLWRDLGRTIPPPPEMHTLLEGAADRLLAVIERTARRGRSPAAQP